MCVGSMYQTFPFRDSDIGINICDHDVWRNIFMKIFEFTVSSAAGKHVCEMYPLKPHFYEEKLGFAGLYLIFLFLIQNIHCGYSLYPPR